MKLLIAILALCSTSLAAGIELVGPTGPIEPKDLAQITVQGIDPEDLGGVNVEYSPSEGVILMRSGGWGGPPSLIFQAKHEGTYTIKLSTNTWVGDLQTGVAGASRVGVTDVELPFDSQGVDNTKTIKVPLAEIAETLAKAHPFRSASFTIHVEGGEGPIPPPVPPVPPVPDKGQRWLIIIRETGQVTPEEWNFISDMETNEWFPTHGHSILIADPDAKTKEGTADPVVESWLPTAREAGLPALIITDLKGKKLWSGPCPLDVDDVIALVKSTGG